MIHLKKLSFSEEDKKEIKRLRKELGDRIGDSVELSKIYAGSIAEPGCGEQCMVTCAHYCKPGCEVSCNNLCLTTCTDYIAKFGYYFIM
jgi:hypothetical protein